MVIFWGRNTIPLLCIWMIKNIDDDYNISWRKTTKNIKHLDNLTFHLIIEFAYFLTDNSLYLDNVPIVMLKSIFMIKIRSSIEIQYLV